MITTTSPRGRRAEPGGSPRRSRRWRGSPTTMPGRGCQGDRTCSGRSTPTGLSCRKRNPVRLAPGGVDGRRSSAPPRTPSCSSAPPTSSVGSARFSRRRPAITESIRPARSASCARSSRCTLAADLLRRARRARGRHPEGGVRHGAADGRRRAALPAGLLPAAHRRSRIAARVLAAGRPRACSCRSCHATGRRPLTVDRAAPRSRRHRPDLAGRHRPRRRCTCSTATAAGERRRSQLDHGPALRRRRPTRGWPSTRCSAIGGVRALRAMGIEPCVVHLNEGHAALAPLEMALAPATATAGRSRHEAFTAAARAHRVHDAHAGARRQRGLRRQRDRRGARAAYRRAGRCSTSRDSSRSGAPTRTTPHEQFGMTPLALQHEPRANGVSRRHGEVAREMWQSLLPERPADDGPDRPRHQRRPRPDLDGEPMRELLDRHLGRGLAVRAPATRRRGRASTTSPTTELWALRNALRARVRAAGARAKRRDRLARDEPR